MLQIELRSELTNRDWAVHRTLENFKALNSALYKGFLNMPVFPIVPLHTEQDLNVLRLSLQNYLKELTIRPDTINSLHVKNFLELENHFTSYMQLQPMLLNEICEEMEVTDICFSKPQKLLFTGLAYSSSSGRIRSYMNSLSSLWNNSNLGGFGIYPLVTSSYGELHMEKIFHQELSSQVSKMHFVDDDTNILLLGLFDGTILIFKLYTRDQTYKGKSLVDLAAKMKHHKNRIIDFEINSSMGYLYSAAYNEKSIVISEINYQSVISTYNVSKYNLNTIVFDKENKRIITTDTNRSLWILHIENHVKIE